MSSFEIIKRWIIGYKKVESLAANKQQLYKFIDEAAITIEHKWELRRLIEQKEQLLSGKPVFKDGYLIDEHFNPVYWTFTKAKYKTIILRFNGYDVDMVSDGGHYRIMLADYICQLTTKTV